MFDWESAGNEARLGPSGKSLLRRRHLSGASEARLASGNFSTCCGRNQNGWAFCRRKVLLALSEALEEFVTLAAAAHEDVLVFQHRLDDTQNWLRPQVVSPIETIHGFEDFFLSRFGVFERALLKAIVLDEIGFVLFHEPSVELGLIVKLGARV